ncbi:hypothetical protein ACFX13_016934 [Malus domestica]|uniref:phytosulfokines-like n=1 Tax=Malus sylvestris TaxID=3752 RepID=UPI0010AAA18A|nr:phytosulfokines-like [Malus domestica]XP_050124568.1 phytosulfokines-like [Malus sylvestris]
MAKYIITFFTIVLLLSFQLTAFAARPVPAAFTNNALKTQHQDIDAEIVAAEGGGSCEGVAEEECLMRRTLAAHVDYIYTQKHKP